MKRELYFSEFSYGYAFTENLCRRSKNYPTTAPRFPNLVEEGRLGYDVKIEQSGIPLFFQFKLPELMMRRRIKGLSARELNSLSVPFFRIPLKVRPPKTSPLGQHDCLRCLERRHRNRVFYASTLSKDDADFHKAYRHAAVHMRSALFSPREIGRLSAHEKHHVIYDHSAIYNFMYDFALRTQFGLPLTPRPIPAWHLSEPKEFQAWSFWDLERDIEESLAKEGAPLRETAGEIQSDVLKSLPWQLRETAGEIRGVVRKRVVENLRDVEPPDDGGDREDRIETVTELLVARELAHVGLGVEMMIAQPRKPE